MIFVFDDQAPTPKKRKGHFKKSRLKLLKKDSSHSTSLISAPSGKLQLYITTVEIEPVRCAPSKIHDK
jgi:hypothetical protein